MERHGMMVHASLSGILSYNESANELATKISHETGHPLIHPFDHPDIWEGHTTIITECVNKVLTLLINSLMSIHQMPKPSVVITVVGGGGLLVGVVQGLHKAGWSDVPVIACETLVCTVCILKFT
jgi:L-serine/L-threonine ammonia-lyase